MKYTSLRQLPARPRVTIAVLYLIVIGLVMASYIIATSRNYFPGVVLAGVLEFVLLVHLIRRA